MLIITATKLRTHLFDYLSKVSKGETIAIHRNGKEVAILMPVKMHNWRNKMKIKPKLLVPVKEAFKPMKDIWENYL